MYYADEHFLPNGITYALLSFYSTPVQGPAVTVMTKAPL